MVPDRECLVWRDRRLTWADVTDRTRRLAAVLREAGLGMHRPLDDVRGLGVAPRPRRPLPPQRQRVPRGHARRRQGPRRRRQRQLPLRRRGAALRPRRQPAPGRSCTTAPSRPRSPRCSPSLAEPPLLLQVDDDSGTPAAPGRGRLRGGAGRRRPRAARGRSAPTTSTSSTRAAPPACPRACCGARPTSSPRASGSTRPPTQLVERRPALEPAGPPGRRRSCTAPPTGTPCRAWTTGGTVVVQDDPARLDPHDVLDTVERERATSLLIVGDAFARPLVDALRDPAATTCRASATCSPAAPPSRPT